MRFLDLALAILIGASAVTGISAWNPRAGDAAANRLGEQMQLRDFLAGMLTREGAAWLLSPSAVCAELGQMSNSSFGVAATLGPSSCGSAPEGDPVTASLSMELAPYEVTLVAWSSA